MKNKILEAIKNPRLFTMFFNGDENSEFIWGRLVRVGDKDKCSITCFLNSNISLSVLTVFVNKVIKEIETDSFESEYDQKQFEQFISDKIKVLEFSCDY